MKPLFSFVRESVGSCSTLRSKKESNQRPSYELLEPRQMLAGDLSLGALNSGIQVMDDAVGQGFVLYSEEAVQTRFAGIGPDNAEHLVAVRLEGARWQYNDDSQWRDFSPTDGDLLVGEVDFGSDKIAALHGEQAIINGVDYGFVDGDLWFAANRFGGGQDDGEFEVFGESVNSNVDSGLTSSPANLRDLADAVKAFSDHHDRVPNIAIFDDAGKPLLSWRVQLLPFLGMQDLYDQFQLDEPWNSGHNLALVDQMPAVFESLNVDETGKTSLMAIGGEGTMFPLTSEQIELRDINIGGDGLANTLLFVEANSNRAVDWTRPFDLTFNPASPLSGLGASGDFAAVSADGRAYQIPATIDPVNFGNMVLRDDGNVVDLSQVRPVPDRSSAFEDISNGLTIYRQFFGEFPAHAVYSTDGSAPLLSWRVAILPYIGHQNLSINLTSMKLGTVPTTWHCWSRCPMRLPMRIWKAG
jgi:hypothetical protein